MVFKKKREIWNLSVVKQTTSLNNTDKLELRHWVKQTLLALKSTLLLSSTLAK